MQRTAVVLVASVSVAAAVVGFAVGSAVSAPTAIVVRDWVSALSGYVAAVGAAAAAWFTIGPLKAQVDVAQRQTEHLLGDAPPDFVVTRKFGQRRLRLRVTNWNRRSIAIDAIEATSAGLPLDIQVMANADVRHEPPQKLRRIHLSGWANRGSGPEVKNVYFFVPELIAEDGSDPLRREVSLRIAFRMLGQEHERQEMTARAIDLS